MRTLRITAAVVGLASVILASGCGPEGRPEAEGPAVAPGRVLFVADEWKQLAPLVAFLRAEGGYAVEMSDQKDLPESVAAYQAIFMYIHGPMTPETERTLVRYASLGGRLVVLHHGMASARARNPEWLKMAGIGILPRDDPKAPWRVVAPVTHTLVNLRPGHYITTHDVKYDRNVNYQSPDAAGLAGEFPALDLPDTEVFLNQQFTDGAEKTVLFGTQCTDPKTGAAIMQDRGGWFKPVGKGRLFYLQPGHAESDFRNRSFCQIILNCLVWQPEAEAATRR
jgi:hypothetical protein